MKASRRKSAPLWKVTVLTTSEAEDAVSELLQSLMGEPVTSYSDVETRNTTVTAYLSDRPDWALLRSKLKQGLVHIRNCGLAIGAGRSSLVKIRREDWAESWKRHFKPISIGRSLLIKPSWSKRRPQKGQAVVVLDPGLSFGTGQHPTTSFCLQQLARRRGSGKSLLDVGCGSGILAIAAAKLGYAPVEAFDFDPEAVQIASANARRNRVAERVTIHYADLTRLPSRSARRYDVVCANLISTLLISEWSRIIGRLKPGGFLITAGILKREFAEVEQAFSSAGYKLVAHRSENEWCSGTFAACKQ